MLDPSFERLLSTRLEMSEEWSMDPAVNTIHNFTCWIVAASFDCHTEQGNRADSAASSTLYAPRY